MVQACAAVVAQSRARGEGEQLLLRLGMTRSTLWRLLQAPDAPGWSLSRLLALIAYEGEHGTTTIRDALCAGDAPPAARGDAVAAYPGAVNLIGRCGRLTQLAAEALAGGRIAAHTAAPLREELAQLVGFARDQLLPDLAACDSTER